MVALQRAHRCALVPGAGLASIFSTTASPMKSGSIDATGSRSPGSARCNTSWRSPTPSGQLRPSTSYSSATALRHSSSVNPRSTVAHGEVTEQRFLCVVTRLAGKTANPIQLFPREHQREIGPGAIEGRVQAKFARGQCRHVQVQRLGEDVAVQGLGESRITLRGQGRKGPPGKSCGLF
jgi:hypothetical protein